VEAYQRFQEVFGKEIRELEQGVVARAIKDETARRETGLQEMHTTLVTHRLPGAEVLAEALDQLRVIRSGGEENAILTFNSCWGELKEALKRAAELAEALTPARLRDLDLARWAAQRHWAFLATESGLPSGLAEQAAELIDLLARETFFRELSRIDQLGRAVTAEYDRRFTDAIDKRSAAYRAALDHLRATPGWDDLTEAQQERVSAPLSGPLAQSPAPTTPIPQLRAETEASAVRLATAIEELMRLVDGNRLVRVRVGSFFSGGVETPEQLDAALQGLRDECERLIGAGKKVLVQ